MHADAPKYQPAVPPGTRNRAPDKVPERIVKADDKNRCTDRLQILRHETHPKLFAGANDKDWRSAG